METEYPKIPTVFRRDSETNYKTLLMGEYATEEIGYLAGARWLFTEKVDGTNIRLIHDGEKLEIRGRTDRAQVPGFLLDCIHAQHPELDIRIKEHFESYWGHDWSERGPVTVVIYGEGYGAKIQKGGGNYREDQGVVVFDIRVNSLWLTRPAVEGTCGSLGLEVVPVIGTGTIEDMVDICRRGFQSAYSVARPDGKYFLAEGIVARPVVDLCDRRGCRIVTKLKHKDFPR